MFGILNLHLEVLSPCRSLHVGMLGIEMENGPSRVQVSYSIWRNGWKGWYTVRDVCCSRLGDIFAS